MLVQEYSDISSEYSEYDDKIGRLLKIGFSEEDIAEIISESNEFVEKRRNILISRKTVEYTSIKAAQSDKDKTISKLKTRVGSMVSFQIDLEEETVKDYIEYAKAQFHLRRLEKQEVQLLSQAMLMDESFVLLGNVNLVATYYMRNNDYAEALGFIVQCSDILDRNDKRRDILSMVKSTIEGNMRKRQERKNARERRAVRNNRAERKDNVNHLALSISTGMEK